MAPLEIMMERQDDDTQTPGERIRDIRERACISADAVATELGIHVSYVTRIETGERAMPEGFEDRYMDALREITRRRAAVIGLTFQADYPAAA